MTLDTLPLSAPTLPACPRHGTPTRLACGRCGAPICPACLVHTAVGMRCVDCAGRPAATRRRRAPLTVVVVVVTVLAAAMWAATQRSGGGAAKVDDIAAAPAPGIGAEVTVGRLAVTVAEFDCTPEDSRPAQRCEASLQVRNDSLAVQEFRPSLQRVTDGFRRFTPIDDVTSVRIDPGEVSQITVAFRVPQTLEPSRLELRTGLRQSPVAVSLPA